MEPSSKFKLFEDIAQQLGCEMRAYSPPYRPQSNGKIECFQKFLKACMGKHISKTLECNEVISMATAAYNFFPHHPSRERPFFLMFGRDPLTGLQKLLGENTRYLDEDGGRLNIEALQNAYQLATQNTKLENEKSGVAKTMVSLKFQPGDMVTIHNHTAKAFDPKY